MLIEELAYQITVQADQFISGQKKVEKGAKALKKTLGGVTEQSEDMSKHVGTAMVKVGQQIRRSAEDTRRPFGLLRGGFYALSKEAQHFTQQSKDAFHQVQLGAGKFLGLALSIEGTRRLFTSSVDTLVDLGNVASNLDLEPKKVEGWKKSAEAVGSSATAITTALMKMRLAKNWSVHPMGSPEESTVALMQLDTQTGVPILSEANPEDIFKKTEQALRKLPKEMQQGWASRIGIELSLLPSILNGSLDTHQSQFEQQAVSSAQLIQQAGEVRQIMSTLKQTIEGVGNSLVTAFGQDAIELMRGFNGWVKDNKEEMIGFFRETADWAQVFSEAVGGTVNALNVLLAIKNPYLAAGIYTARKANEISSLITKHDKTHSLWQSLKERMEAGGWYNYEKLLEKKQTANALTARIGTTADRNHNPGNLRSVEQGGFRSFANDQAGWQAMRDQLSRYFSGETTGKPLRTIRDIVTTWAPAQDGNDPERYANEVGRWMQMAPDVPLDLNKADQMAQLMRAIARKEGFSHWQNPAVDATSFPAYQQQLNQYAALANVPHQYQSTDNSQTNTTHIGTVQVTTQPQSVDAILESIIEQQRRSNLSGAFVSGNG